MNPWAGIRGLPRAVWVLSGATLVNRMGTMVLPFLVLYLTESVKLTPRLASGMLALYGVTAIVVTPLAGWLSDRFGPAALMRASLVGTGAALLVFPLARSLPGVIAVTVLFAIANEPFRPASLAILSDLVPPEQRRAAFALNRLVINLGMSVGPAAGGFLAKRSFTSLFVVDAATTLAAATILLVARLPRAAHPHEKQGSPLSAINDRRLLWFLLATIPVGIVFFQHASSMPLFMKRELHLEEDVFGLMFTLNTILIVLFEVPLNLAMSRWPHRHSLALGAALTGAGFSMIGIAAGAWGIAASTVVWTFGEMILLPSMSAYVADISPPDRRGAYMALYTTAFAVCFSVGPWLGTAVLIGMGAPILWGGTLVLGLVSALALWTVR